MGSTEQSQPTKRAFELNAPPIRIGDFYSKQQPHFMISMANMHCSQQQWNKQSQCASAQDLCWLIHFRICLIIITSATTPTQCAAVCCSVLQCVAVRYSVLPSVVVCCSASRCGAVRCSVLQSNAVWCTMRGGGLGSSTIFKKFNEPYAPS